MRLAAILSALLVSASAFAQTPQDPTAPDTRVLDARIRALERSASSGSGSLLLRVNTSAGTYVAYTNPATITLQADGGYLRTAGSSLLDPPWRNPVVWFPSGGGSSSVYVDPATLSGDGSSPAALRRLAWRGAHATNGILGTGTASDPLRILPTYLPGGEGFPLANDVTFASNSASDIGGLQFVGSTNVLASDGTNLLYGGHALGSGSGSGSLAEFVATHTNSLQVTNSEIARLELVAGDNVVFSHDVAAASSSSVVRISAPVGSSIVALACSIGNSQPLPVTFQYSSSCCSWKPSCRFVRYVKA